MSLFLNAGTITALVSLVAFVVQYTWYSPWWKDPIGRTVVALDIALVLPLLVRVLVFARVPWVTGRESGWSYGIAFWSIAVIITWRMVIWSRIQRSRRNTKRDS